MLRRLQRGRPANSEPLALLDEKDAGLRWRAAYALAESGDPRLALTVHATKHRKSGSRKRTWPFYFHPRRSFRCDQCSSDYSPTKRWTVMSSVATLFATRKDAECARVLYDLLTREEKLEPWRQSNLVQALQTMTGFYFGFIPGTISTESSRQVLFRLANRRHERVGGQLLRNYFRKPIVATIIR